MAQASLRILETTDLHMQLDAFDYLLDEQGRDPGLSGLAPLIKDARADGVETILCDNGDFLQGSPLANTLADQPSTEPHPMIAAFNALKYDAITLGNHEFNYGLQRLCDILTHAEAPIISANLRISPREKLTAPWTIVVRHLKCDDQQTRPIRVGIIGFVTPKVTDWDCVDPEETIIADDIVAAAQTALPSLKRAGADIIVALCHTGIGSATHSSGMENAALPLAALPDIDVLLTGHAHDQFPGPDFLTTDVVDAIKGTLHRKPAVMAGCYGSHLGVIDLTLQNSGAGWSISDHKSELRPALPTDQNLFATPLLQSAHDATRARLSEPLAQCALPMTTHFAAIGYDPASALKAQAKIAAIRPLTCQSEFADLPLLASASSFRMGGHGGPRNFHNIGATELTRRTVAAISPFNSPVCAVLRRGWQLRAWLEHAAGYFQKITLGQKDQPLINPHMASFQFDTLYGLNYRFDLSKPQGAGRVVDLEYNGNPVLDDTLFLVATNSFRANGGGNYEPVHKDDIAYQSPLGVASALTQYLVERAVVTPSIVPVWSFVPAPGASVVFQTSPNVQTETAPRPVIRLPDDDAGFTRLRMML